MWSWALATALAGQVQLGAGARGELQAGQAPISAGESSSWFAASLLTPHVSVAWLEATGDGRLLYAPRLLWRRPNPTEGLRPLVLHIFRADAAVAPGPRSEARVRLAGSMGDVDYAALNEALGTQASLPSTTRLYTLDASARVAWRATRGLRWETTLAAIRRAGLDDRATLPDETRLALEPRLTWSASRLDTLSLYVETALYRLSGPARLDGTVWAPRLAWRHRLGRSQDVLVSAGVAWAHALNDNRRPFSDLTPLAELAWLTHVGPVAGLILRSSLSVDTGWHLDPVLVTALPRALASARVALEGTHDSAELWAQFATNGTARPIAAQPDETVLTGGLRLTWRASDMLLLEVGSRFSDRAPHLRARNWHLHAREWVGYVAATMMMSTTRSPAEP